MCIRDSHQRGATAAKGVKDNGVLLGGIADRIAEQVQRFGGRVALIALRLVIVPDGSLAAVRIPGVLATLLPSKTNRLMLSFCMVSPSELLKETP